ncbi:hypothetical protein PY310_05315 [Pseudarthrobacter sp. H3Y2-7]|uniref:hypothetical protein n=1 Tax=Pseudarthrobacter naphthalenicus TaxID=3031328 RepID=UPI0023AF51E1|nr:hypothetical protein [Pseudarthrobacter sp. H3Y2-7]MDE8668002.1 hypothetical protein [Pseudarthrobacter sp. H3Y2-7]
MNDNPFISYAGRYWQNLEGSAATHARAGIIENPNGFRDPSVVIFRDRFCLAVLTVEDATRLSNELIDQIERPVV